jgi:hypothetical protein
MLRSNTTFLDIICLLSSTINQLQGCDNIAVPFHELHFRSSSAKLTNSCITAQVCCHVDVEHHEDSDSSQALPVSAIK